MEKILMYLIAGSSISFINTLYSKEKGSIIKTLFIILLWPIILIVGIIEYNKSKSNRN